MFEKHSRKRVNVQCAPYGSDDGTMQRIRIIKACDTFVNTSMISDYAVAKTMTFDMNAHIAVDLMAHTTGTRIGIPAYHPGVILVNYLGYPGTMGTFADFMIIDKYCVPPDTISDEVSCHKYSIKLKKDEMSLTFSPFSPTKISEYAVYLPHHYQANDFPLDIDLFPYEKNRKGGAAWPVVQDDPISLRRNSQDVQLNNHSLRHPFSDVTGNSKKTIVMCNFNTVAKMEPIMYRVWLDILSRSPNTILWLLSPKGKMGQIVIQNLKREARR
jgi:hypothetical protein